MGFTKVGSVPRDFPLPRRSLTRVSRTHTHTYGSDLTRSVVSDVFHTGAPESTLWEFKHGNGSFKRGHIQGLRDIKRRASRHALINRDTYSTAPKPNMSQPGAPAEPMLDSTEARLQHLEHSLYDVHARLGRSEEHNQMLVSRYQFLQEGLMRCHQVRRSSSPFTLLPSPLRLLSRSCHLVKCTLCEIVCTLG